MATINANWQRINLQKLPSPRIGSSLIYNPKDSHAFLFGGHRSSEGNLNESWYIDGNKVEQIQSRLLPTKRSFMNLTWDEKRDNIVLFGGLGDDGLLDNTWIFDDNQWIQQEPRNVPPPRTSSGIAFDTMHQITIIFGGLTSKNQFAASTKLNDTWAWDGLNWQQLFPTNSPTPRSAFQLVYDRARQSILLFGGGESASLFNDTWIWNGTSWVEQHPLHSPSARIAYGMAYHENKQQVILFGGVTDGHMATDTWAWDGKDWFQLQTQISPPPEVAYCPQLAYLSNQQSLIMYNAFIKKTVVSFGNINVTERSEFWQLIY